MGWDFLGAVIAFVLGTGIAVVNFLISKRMLKKNSNIYASTHIIRQLLQVGYLVLILCFGKFTPWDEIWLLVGGCLGVSLPMLFFTYKLVKLNDSSHREEDYSNG